MIANIEAHKFSLNLLFKIVLSRKDCDFRSNAVCEKIDFFSYKCSTVQLLIIYAPSCLYKIGT